MPLLAHVYFEPWGHSPLTSIQTRQRRALVDKIRLTSLSPESRGTIATKRLHEINAYPAVEARVGRALRPVVHAVDPREAWGAGAVVAIDSVRAGAWW